MKKTFELNIESLSYGGRGIGKIKEGKVVFVPLVIPGERVCVEVCKEHSTFIEAKLVEIITRSSSRVNPVCEVFSCCGGCTWQHISYNDQLTWKHDILLREILKVCKTVPEDINPPQPSHNVYGYRCHARIQCSCAPELKLGFFQESSNAIVAFKKCPVLVPSLQKTLDDLACVLAKHTLPEPYEIDIRSPEDGVILLVRCKDHMRESDVNAANLIFDALQIKGMAITSLFNKKQYVMGRPYCSYAIPAGDSFIRMVSGVEGFIQANTHINCEMIKYVASLASGSEHLLDLYCGNGNFSLPLARLAKKITAIDNNRELIQQAKAIASEHGIGNIKFYSRDAQGFLKSISRESSRFDTIILDPPREGAKEIMKSLDESKVSRIIYISCNPTTMVRDIKAILLQGFCFKSIKVFDMFPHTYHIESVAYLER